MARLPSGNYLMQQIGDDVILFEDGSERELVKFYPADRNTIAQTQLTTHELTELSEEDRCFAHFWSGYFYAYATQSQR